MPKPDDSVAGTAERRLVSLAGVAKKCGGIILSDGEVWNGTERRESEKKSAKKPSEDKSKSGKEDSCDFFG
ncbi:MAG: hypothetical protein HQK86_14180 [Nitrospinae bacterium]|nr:hypothetical protein [Nitrospinota bacterium]